ncbi:MAG: hypothetical protein LBH03_00125 [Holophagales bacterium]|jgi:CheY-like chemotaxis protein|nr:hypothetical protein [Holophagales bacterium]
MGQRLLVLDTDSTFIDEHRLALEFDFDVDYIDSHDNIIKVLEDGGYAAILIGVEVAENRGYAVCASIRNRSSLSSLKIALISSKATKEDFVRHGKLRVRADLYLFKPIETGALISELKAFMPSKASDLDNAYDAPIEVHTSEERLKSSNSIELTKEDESLPVSPVIEPQAETAWLIEGRHENQETQNQNNTITATLEKIGVHEDLTPTHNYLSKAKDQQGLLTSTDDLEARVHNLEAELQAKTAVLLELQEENQELQHRNTSITVNIEELEAHQKNAEALQCRLQEAEKQLKYLESGASLEDYANESLRNRLKGAIAEKQTLLQQIETLTQEIAEKNLQAVAFLKSKEELLQQLLDVEESRHRLEQEFEVRVETERRLLISRLDDYQDSGPATRKRISELEDVCTAKTKELEFIRAAHSEEIRRLTEDFESQRQNLISFINTRQEEIRSVLSGMDEAREALTKLLVGNLATEGGS